MSIIDEFNYLSLAASASAPENQRSIVLLDDDPLFQRTMLAVAKRKEIDFISCGSFSQFKKVFLQHHPGIVILDYHLGEEVTGCAIADQIMENTKVILVSGSGPWISESNIPKELQLAIAKHGETNCFRFVHKLQGARAIMNNALNMLET